MFFSFLYIATRESQGIGKGMIIRKAGEFLKCVMRSRQENAEPFYLVLLDCKSDPGSSRSNIGTSDRVSSIFSVISE